MYQSPPLAFSEVLLIPGPCQMDMQGFQYQELHRQKPVRGKAPSDGKMDPEPMQQLPQQSFSPWILGLSGEAQKDVWWKIYLLQSNLRICILFSKTSRLFMFHYPIPWGRAPIWEALSPLEAWEGVCHCSKRGYRHQSSSHRDKGCSSLH